MIIQKLQREKKPKRTKPKPNLLGCKRVEREIQNICTQDSGNMLSRGHQENTGQLQFRLPGGMLFCCFLLPTLLSAQNSVTYRLDFPLLTSPDCTICSSGSSPATPKCAVAIKRNRIPTYTASFCLVAPYSWLCSGQVSILTVEPARMAVMQGRMWPLNFFP